MTLAVAQELLPPQNLEAERSVLGACLIDKDAIALVAEVLDTDNVFYRRAHQVVFDCMKALHELGEPVDLITLSNMLERREQFQEVGGSDYLLELLEVVPTAANCVHYARIVRERAIRRELIRAGTSIVQMAHEPAEDVSELINRAEQIVFNVAEKRVVQDFEHIKPVLKRSFARLESVYEKGGSISGISTGYRDLDEMIGGLQRSSFIILAARPSMGKTALALNIAQNVAIGSKLPVAVFSLEMSKEELGSRMLSSESRIEGDRIKNGRIHDNDWRTLSHAMNVLTEAPMFIDDAPGITIMEIASKSRRLKKQHGLDLIVIDYIQLIRGSARYESNRVQELGEISRHLKFLCKELNIPIVVLSQLSRAVESRTDKRPMLSDLRESGAIEQEADLVMFIYRDEYYEKENSEKQGIAEIIVAKHRSGPTGSVDLHFNKQFVRFENLARGFGV
ncbi:MAG: replicative DNA helicase [Armatimonadetes bacterium]|nr:replicative DNA helicase [Armatimonadota bacterium]